MSQDKQVLLRSLVQVKRSPTRLRIRYSVIFLITSASFALAFPLNQVRKQEAPGPLSIAHAVTPGISNCSACHTPQYEVKPEKCLICHGEISKQASSEKGYHRDKQEDCFICHIEHQGSDALFVPLDLGNFDHSETGTELQGAHRKIEDCSLCHRPELSLPRNKTRSYIFNDSTCRTCHDSPHPGRQIDCLACHNRDSWIVRRGGSAFP